MHLKHSIWVFFVQSNCKSEDFHIVQGDQTAKKEKYTLKLIRLINLECSVGIRLKPWPVYKAVLRHKE